jgi:hypothetical protein
MAGAVRTRALARKEAAYFIVKTRFLERAEWAARASKTDPSNARKLVNLPVRNRVNGGVVSTEKNGGTGEGPAVGRLREEPPEPPKNFLCLGILPVVDEIVDHRRIGERRGVAEV